MIGRLQRIGLGLLGALAFIFAVFNAGRRQEALQTRAKDLEDANDMLSEMGRVRPPVSVDDAFDSLRARSERRGLADRF